MADTEPRGTLGTVRNAVLLLDLLSEGPAYQHLTDLADRSGLSVPTVHRLLRSLVLADLVEQDQRSARYGLGPEVSRLSQRYLGRLPILGALSPYLVQLRDAVGRTVSVALLVRGTVVYVDRVDGDDGGPYRDSHRVLTVGRTAAGRVLAGRADPESWQQCLDATEGEERRLLGNERDTWRAASYLVSFGDDLTVPDEVAVPVLDGRGRAVAALAATLEAGTDDGTVERLAAQLARAAAAAGRTLAHD